MNPKNPKWKTPKFGIRTFIDDPYFLNVEKETYPTVKDICEGIIKGKFVEAVEVAGIGSGKSYSAEILACYCAYHLLCLTDAHQYYGLARDKYITIINMGINSTQALEVVFAGIKSFVAESPYFQSLNPEIKVSSIKFPDQKIMLMSGNSKSTTPLGYNIFAAVLDEAAFYLDNENRSVAEEIYNALQRRIVSRFGTDGLLAMISSPRYTDDFIMRKLDESKQFPDQVFSVQLPTWKVKNNKQVDLTKTFYFNPNTGEVRDDKPEYTTSINKVTDPNFEARKHDWWEIPIEFKKSFQMNPEKAKRDFGAVPSLTIEGFFPRPEIVAEAFDSERTNPVLRAGEYKFDLDPLRIPYYIHIDLALNRKGKGDFAAISMAHFNGWKLNEKTEEKLPSVYVDLVERIGADKTGEIDFARVRQRIYDLKAMGFNIRLITFDQYQSRDSIQLLKKKGYKTDLLSVDRTIDPYNVLKELIYDSRVSIHPHQVAQEELCRLELVKGNKIDHPPNGSKDCADAICGAVYNVITNTSNQGLGFAVGDMGSAQVVSNVDSPNKSNEEELQAIREKEAYYRQLESDKDQGWLDDGRL